MQVLGTYNQELTSALARAQQQWPTLCASTNDSLPEQELEERRWTLLLAMAYLDQLNRLLCRQADQHEAATFWDGARLLPPDIRSAQ